MNLEKLKEKKVALEASLTHCKIALAHDEYSKPFVFKRMDRMTVDMVKHPTLKSIVTKCVDRNIGFDPSLAIQHIERESLEQYNEIVLEKIKGSSIPALMEMRHELELLMLKDQFEHYTREIAKMEKIILESVTGVAIEEKPKSAKGKK
jgi:hypothetical protein